MLSIEVGGKESAAGQVTNIQESSINDDISRKMQCKASKNKGRDRKDGELEEQRTMKRVVKGEKRGKMRTNNLIAF